MTKYDLVETTVFLDEVASVPQIAHLLSCHYHTAKDLSGRGHYKRSYQLVYLTKAKQNPKPRGDD